MEKRDVFDEMEAKWDWPVVARTAMNRFSGDMISSKYMANLDSMGLGPKRITCGRKVGYPVRDLVKWMRERSII